MFKILWLATVTAGAAAEQCTKDTGGDCNLIPCDSLRNSVCALKGPDTGKCMCGDDDCAVNGLCLDKGACNTHTEGTCQFLGCDASRGPTVCRQTMGAGLGGSWTCECVAGYCNINGVCVNAPDKEGANACQKMTGGTCKFGGCASSRNAECTNTKCVCGDGMCADDKGVCAPEGKSDQSATLLQRTASADHGIPMNTVPLGGFRAQALLASLGVFTMSLFAAGLWWRSHSRNTVDIPEMTLG